MPKRFLEEVVDLSLGVGLRSVLCCVSGIGPEQELAARSGHLHYKQCQCRETRQLSPSLGRDFGIRDGKTLIEFNTS